MTAAPYPTPKLGAIAVVLHEDRFLLVQRGKDPGRGLWGFPGGHVELGETGLAAAERELREETSVIAEAAGYLTNVDAIARGPDGEIAYHYLIAAALCVYQSGTPSASDDAAAAEWVPVNEVLAGTRQLHDDVIRVARLAIETELI
jgi:ADP-ribose pyrophosphatase YjhB (NUDIX family)